MEKNDKSMSNASLGLTERCAITEKPSALGMAHASGSKSNKPMGVSPGHKGGGKHKGNDDF